MSSREENNQIAKLAEQAERYDEMAESMTKIVKSGGSPLTTEERNLFSVAYKNVVGSKRSSWRIVSTLEQKGGDIPKTIIENYRITIENDLNETCDKVIDLLDNHLISDADDIDTDSRIFYLKMKGDYLRYKVEVFPDTKIDDNPLAIKSAEAYAAAYEIAKEKVAPTDPIRLGLALNYSVFYYEIAKKPDKACELAQEAFTQALPAIQNLDKEDNHTYKDSTLILQLLRDNLTLWTSQADTNQETLEDYDPQELDDQ